MATLGDVIATVQTDYLVRADLTNLVTKQAVRVYQTICGKIPFEELQSVAPPINCVANTAEYDLGGLTPPLAGIASLKINYGGGRTKRLKRDHTRNFDAIPPQGSREPVSYARWGKKIEVWPPPAAAYVMTLKYWAKANINATPANTVLACPDEWVELLEWETYYRTLTVLGRAPEAAMLVQPAMVPRGPAPKKILQSDIGIIPRLWNELLLTIQQREYVDEEYSIQPVVL